MVRPDFQAVVLAGGFGHQLSVLVDDCPKGKWQVWYSIIIVIFIIALLPIANRPMISFVIRWLEDAGITDIIVVTNDSAAPKLSNYLR